MKNTMLVSFRTSIANLIFATNVTQPLTKRESEYSGDQMLNNMIFCKLFVACKFRLAKYEKIIVLQIIDLGFLDFMFVRRNMCVYLALKT